MAVAEWQSTCCCACTAATTWYDEHKDYSRRHSDTLQEDELEEMLDDEDDVGELSGDLAAVALAATGKELTYQVWCQPRVPS
jgi:hypothetical protein